MPGKLKMQISGTFYTGMSLIAEYMFAEYFIILPFVVAFCITIMNDGEM